MMPKVKIFKNKYVANSIDNVYLRANRKFSLLGNFYLIFVRCHVVIYILYHPAYLFLRFYVSQIYTIYTIKHLCISLNKLFLEPNSIYFSRFVNEIFFSKIGIFLDGILILFELFMVSKGYFIISISVK